MSLNRLGDRGFVIPNIPLRTILECTDNLKKLRHVKNKYGIRMFGYTETVELLVDSDNTCSIPLRVRMML